MIIKGVNVKWWLAYQFFRLLNRAFDRLAGVEPIEDPACKGCEDCVSRKGKTEWN